MYNNAKTPGAVNKVLYTFFVIFLITMIGILSMAVLDHIDGESMTATAGNSEREECGDSQAQNAAQRAGIKVPVKCQKKSQ